MLDLWLRTLGDLRSAKILMLMAIPFVAAIILVSLLGYGIFGFFIFSDFITQNPMVLEMQQSMESAEETIGSIPLIGGVLLWIIGIAVTVVAGILGFLLGSYLILIFAMIITGFMTDALVKAVRDLNYPGLEYQGHGSMTEMIWKVFKYALGMLLLFLVTIPMLFIPVVNIVWFWLLGFMFFRYSVVLDVGMVILPKDVYEKHNALSKWTPTSAQAGIFSLSLFPIMGLIVPVLAVIAQAHYFFDKLTESQANAAKSEVLTQQ
jgi:hypothetical protein